MRRTPALVIVPLLLSLCSAGAVAAPAILLQSDSGDSPEDARQYAAHLLHGLGPLAPMSGRELAAMLEQRFSESAGDLSVPQGLRSAADEGRRHFIEGEFTAAIAQLEDARSLLQQRVAALSSDQSLRDSLHRALLFLAHAYLRTKQPERAAERISEVIRSFPDRDVSTVQVQYGPELVRLYRAVRREMDAQPRGTLAITTQPPGCLVFLNERFVGLSPARVVDLYPGRYRVYLQHHQRRGRVHLINVSGAEHSLEVGFDFDTVLQTSPAPGLRFSNGAALERNEVSYASQVGLALEASSVLLLGVRRHRGRRVLLGTTVAPATGRAVRAGMVVLEPIPPSPDSLRALGRFLLAGENGEGVIVRSPRVGNPAEQDQAAGAPAGRKFFRAGVFKWITLGAGAAGVASGAVLLSINGQGTCSASGGVRCPDNYNTGLPGALIVAAGGLSLVGSAVLFYWDARHPKNDRRTALVPWLAASTAGLAATVRY